MTDHDYVVLKDKYCKQSTEQNKKAKTTMSVIENLHGVELHV